MFAKNWTLEPDPCLVSPQRFSHVLREHILHVLEKTGWHVDDPTGAAHILGIRASALRRRMRELGLESRQGCRDPARFRLLNRLDRASGAAAPISISRMTKRRATDAQHRIAPLCVRLLDSAQMPRRGS
jgi:hypothetical protein